MKSRDKILGSEVSNDSENIGSTRKLLAKTTTTVSGLKSLLVRQKTGIPKNHRQLNKETSLFVTDDLQSQNDRGNNLLQFKEA